MYLNEQEKITSRGVVYAVSQYPVYRTEEADATDEENSGGIFPPTDNENAYETVRSGQTSDGDGLGRYSSDMLEIFLATCDISPFTASVIFSNFSFNSLKSLLKIPA